MSYTGPDLDDLRDLVTGIVLRPLAPAPGGNASPDVTLLNLCINGALITLQDSYDGWRVMQATVTAYDDAAPLQTAAGVRTVAIPARYKDGARLHYLSDGSYLVIPMVTQGKAITMEWIRTNHPNPALTAAAPEAMCIWGETFVLVPTPSGALTLQLDCRQYVLALTADSDRNWFTMHLTMPLVQIAAAEAFSILGEEGEAARFLEMARRALSDAVGTEITELVRRTPLMVGQEPS